MARIRSVHPGLFTDEAFVALSSDAQILLIGLWTESDDQGVFEWKPITLRMRLRPAKDGDITALLGELISANTVAQYEVGGRQYGAIRNFRKYQRPKTPNAVHPLPSEWRNYVGLVDAVSETPEVKPTEFPPKGEIAPQMEDGGKDGGKGKDVKLDLATLGRAIAAASAAQARGPVAVSLPTNRVEVEFPVFQADVDDYARTYPGVNVPQELREMRRWLLDNAENRKTAKGVPRFVNAWLSKEQDRSGNPRGRGSTPAFADPANFKILNPLESGKPQ